MILKSNLIVNDKKLRVNDHSFVIGVDGGGTKTLAALADVNGKIIKTAKAGCSNPRNVGIRIAAANIAGAIFKIIKGALKKHKGIAAIFNGRVMIVSDQLVAFRSGSGGKDGISVIAGTGCVVHGWNRGQETKVNGWGWLADEGSGFWIGQKTFQTILKGIDGRLQDASLLDLVKKTFKIKNVIELITLAYKDPEIFVPRLAALCRQADEAGDANAHGIMHSAGKEIALSVVNAYQRLGFGKQVPEIVFIGGIFNSSTIIKSVKAELKKSVGDVNIIKPELPVVGAIRLALEA